MNCQPLNDILFAQWQDQHMIVIIMVTVVGSVAAISLFLLITALLWAFSSFHDLVKIEHENFHAQWIKDGYPLGIYVDRMNTRSYLRSGFASPWLMLSWLFLTPKWVNSSKRAIEYLRRYRVLVLTWNIGLTLWSVLFMIAFVV